MATNDSDIAVCQHLSRIHVQTLVPGYKEARQALSFAQWLDELAETSRRTHAAWSSELARAEHYESRPDRWVSYYAAGYTTDAAVEEDLYLFA